MAYAHPSTAVSTDDSHFASREFRGSRRQFLAASASALLASRVSFGAGPKRPPLLGVQVYSVHDLFRQDAAAALSQLQKIGFRTLELENLRRDQGAPAARLLRQHIDALGLECLSAHCPATDFTGPALDESLTIAAILGCQLLVMPHPGQVVTEWRSVAGWQKVADVLNAAVAPARDRGFRIGYHNHDPEFLPLAEGRAPIDIIAQSTASEIALELDVGNCLASHGDPVAFLRTYGARVSAMHVKDFATGSNRYNVALGQGDADWHGILTAALPHVATGYYFVEMEPQTRAPVLSALEQDYTTARRLLSSAATS